MSDAFTGTTNIQWIWDTYSHPKRTCANAFGAQGILNHTNTYISTSTHIQLHAYFIYILCNPIFYIYIYIYIYTCVYIYIHKCWTVSEMVPARSQGAAPFWSICVFLLCIYRCVYIYICVYPDFFWVWLPLEQAPEKPGTMVQATSPYVLGSRRRLSIWCPERRQFPGLWEPIRIDTLW